MLGCTRVEVVGLLHAAIITPADGGPFSICAIPRSRLVRMAVYTSARQLLTVSAACAAQPECDGQIRVLHDMSDDATIRQIKDALLADTTYELRTPLAAQIAALEILREQAESLTIVGPLPDAVADGRRMVQVLITWAYEEPSHE